MFENLDKYLPLYYKNEEGEFQELTEVELDDIFGKDNSPISLFNNFLSNMISPEVIIETTEGGTWTVRTYLNTNSGLYTVCVWIYDTLKVPVYESENEDEASFAHNMYVAGFESHTIKKLTNIYNGDIINIEVKDIGEEIDDSD